MNRLEEVFEYNDNKFMIFGGVAANKSIHKPRPALLLLSPARAGQRKVQQRDYDPRSRAINQFTDFLEIRKSSGPIVRLAAVEWPGWEAEPQLVGCSKIFCLLHIHFNRSFNEFPLGSPSPSSGNNSNAIIDWKSQRLTIFQESYSILSFRNDSDFAYECLLTGLSKFAAVKQSK